MNQPPPADHGIINDNGDKYFASKFFSVFCTVVFMTLLVFFPSFREKEILIEIGWMPFAPLGLALIVEILHDKVK